MPLPRCAAVFCQIPTQNQCCCSLMHYTRLKNKLSFSKLTEYYFFNNNIIFIKILTHNTFHTLINIFIRVKVQVKILHMNYRPRTDFPIHVVMKCVLHVSHNECLCHITKHVNNAHLLSTVCWWSSSKGDVMVATEVGPPGALCFFHFDRLHTTPDSGR